MYYNNESEYVYYESEPTAPYKNYYETYDLGEYVLPPQTGGHNLYTNEPTIATSSRQTKAKVIQDEYDEDNYTLARTSTCPNKINGVLKDVTSESKPNTKEGISRKKDITIAILLVCVLIIVGGLTVAVVLAYQTGIIFVIF